MNTVILCCKPFSSRFIIEQPFPISPVFKYYIAPDKKGYQENIVLIFPQKRGYSLEVPCQGPQHLFSCKNKKISAIFD